MSWMTTLTARRDPVQREGWRDDAPAHSTPQQRPAVVCDVTALELRQAAERFEARRDSFAQGKGYICRDMASKLDRFGSFASEKQAEFARKLVEWSKPRQDQQQRPAPAELRVDTLHAVLQKHAKFYVGLLTISRRNADQLCWIKHDDCEQVIGKIDGGAVALFDGRLRNAGIDREEIVALLKELDADPLEAAKKHGKLAGRCCSCGRELTNDGSIELGIGPICAEKFAGF